MSPIRLPPPKPSTLPVFALILLPPPKLSLAFVALCTGDTTCPDPFRLLRFTFTVCGLRAKIWPGPAPGPPIGEKFLFRSGGAGAWFFAKNLFGFPPGVSPFCTRFSLCTAGLGWVCPRSACTGPLFWGVYTFCRRCLCRFELIKSNAFPGRFCASGALVASLWTGPPGEYFSRMWLTLRLPLATFLVKPPGAPLRRLFLLRIGDENCAGERFACPVRLRV